MKVTHNTKIILDGETYLLEEGDEIVSPFTIDEGLVSRAFLSIINKIIPIDMFRKMDPQAQSMFANIVKDPEKAKKLAKLYKEKPDFLNIFT